MPDHPPSLLWKFFLTGIERCEQETSFRLYEKRTEGIFRGDVRANVQRRDEPSCKAESCWIEKEACLAELAALYFPAGGMWTRPSLFLGRPPSY
jgi:hypothetical protein